MIDRANFDRMSNVLSRIRLSIFGIPFTITLQEDMIFRYLKGRPYMQLSYKCHDTKTGAWQTFKCRKWYLSAYMTNDEIVKTAYAAFEMAVKHEILEGFTVDSQPIFNPHLNFEELIKIADREVTRASLFPGNKAGLNTI